MPGVVLGCCGGSLEMPFEMPGVREYRSKCMLGKMRSRALGLQMEC
jgi:hypothetical protein